MTTLHLCPAGWELYDKWDTLCTGNTTHEPTAEECERENDAWVKYQDHRNGCETCRKDSL